MKGKIMAQKISDKLQYVCDSLDVIIESAQEREWVSARIIEDIDAGVNQDAMARELADEYRIEMPKDVWAVFA